jgi:hypothetical protein
MAFLSAKLDANWSAGMAIPTHDEARAIISPKREEKIVWAFSSAWSDWEGCPDRTRYSRWPRTRANMVFERLAERLQEALGDDDGVKFHFQDETIKVVFDDQIVARVKKANGLGLGQNIQTAAVTRFVEAQSDIDGFGAHKKIEIVYFLNLLQTAISSVVAQARDGEMQIWVWTLGKGAEGAEIVPFPLPDPPRRPALDVADEIVRARPTKPGETAEGD